MKIQYFRFIYILVFLCFAGELQATISPANSLSGTVKDKSSGAPLPGVTIYIPDLKTGTITNTDGKYQLENLPASKLIVQVTFIGFKRIVLTVDLNNTSVVNFEMEPAVSELHEIVVTGLSQTSERNHTPATITTIPELELKQNSSVNLIDALTVRPGVSQISSGPGISKPVIRGLGFNRVVVVHDGIRQEGQQWGDEHGIEIDANAVNSVEILKGPASLMYGSDAMAGVINFLPAPTLPVGIVNAGVNTVYQSNNGLFGYSVNAAGTNRKLLWDLRWSDKSAHAYKNKYDGYVYNSGYSESDLDGTIGVRKSWGYSHLNFSIYELKPGLVEGERDSITGKFTKTVVLNDSVETSQIVTNGELKSYDVDVPYQLINHYKIVSDNNFIIGQGSLKTTIGWQLNKRREFADFSDPGQYGLYFKLNTLNYNFRYVLPQSDKYDVSIGLNGMWQQSENAGTEFLVPAYHLFDAGLYLLFKKTFDRLDIAGGMRYDHRNQTANELFVDDAGVQVDAGTPGAIQKFNSFDKQIGGISGSAGLAYQLNEILYTKLNLSRGYRAPNIAELGSNGIHEGSGRYEIGDPSLKAEGSWQTDFTFGINSSHITGELNLFSNSIDHFIFISKLTNTAGGDSLIEDNPVFKYTSDKANLTGGEISIDIHPHPLDWLHFENSFALVNGIRVNQPDSVKYLPFIPAAKYSSVLKADFKKVSGLLANAFVKAGIDYYFKQDKIYSVNQTESVTGSYALVNIGLGTDIMLNKRTPISIYVGMNNVFDTTYQNHLSRLKYAPENYATGRTGIYDMGRNLTVKLTLNIESVSKK